MPKAADLLPRVRELLFRDWNPIRVNDNPQCANEYDSYAPSIVSLLLADADEYKLTAHLAELQRVSIGMSVVNEALHRRVARQLLSLRE